MPRVLVRLLRLVRLAPHADLLAAEATIAHLRTEVTAADEHRAAIRSYFLQRLSEEATQQTRLRNLVAAHERTHARLNGRIGSLTAQLNRARAAVAERGD